MALLYLIGAIDFHHENLIACGEHPVLIDLETLFHPDLEARELTPDRERPVSSLWDSVLRIGLLPWPGRDRLLQAARAAARRLCTLAFEEPGGVNWISTEHGGLGWSFQSMKPPGIGGFQGWGGVIYCLAHLGALWGDETLLDEAEALALDLGPKIDQDEHNDVIAGTAGCLLALLSLQRVKPSERLRQLALRCGERLIDAARPRKRGLGWVSPIVGPQPIGGLSHGASGIALALFRLWQESGDERFRRTALEGFEFERSLYSPEHRNWIDLRAGAAEMATDEGRLYPCGWCHGAPGIGLARVAVLVEDGV